MVAGRQPRRLFNFDQSVEALDSHSITWQLVTIMGRPPLHERPMTPTERKRRQRQRIESAALRSGRIRRAFVAAGADAQYLFLHWLKKMKFME
jgi:hypothetical protein